MDTKEMTPKFDNWEKRKVIRASNDHFRMVGEGFLQLMRADSDEAKSTALETLAVALVPEHADEYWLSGTLRRLLRSGEKSHVISQLGKVSAAITALYTEPQSRYAQNADVVTPVVLIDVGLQFEYLANNAIFVGARDDKIITERIIAFMGCYPDVWLTSNSHLFDELWKTVIERVERSIT